MAAAHRHGPGTHSSQQRSQPREIPLCPGTSWRWSRCPCSRYYHHVYKDGNNSPHGRVLITAATASEPFICFQHDWLIVDDPPSKHMMFARSGGGGVSKHPFVAARQWWIVATMGQQLLSRMEFFGWFWLTSSYVYLLTNVITLAHFMIIITLHRSFAWQCSLVIHYFVHPSNIVKYLIHEYHAGVTWFRLPQRDVSGEKKHLMCFNLLCTSTVEWFPHRNSCQGH